jgi:hypothetical protein
VDALTHSGDTDNPGTRDYWYYVGYVTDQYGTRSPASEKTAALDYFLGDVTNGATPGTGDDKVEGIDVSLLGNNYGQPGPNYLDVGPTSNSWVDGLPLTDDRLDFEDLVIFALNYGGVSAPPAAARPVAASSGDALVLERPEKVAVGTPVTVTLTLKGSGALRAVSTQLAWDAAVVEPMDHTAGAWLTAQNGVAFSAKPGMVDAAVLGGGLTGEGTLATVRFKVLAAGDPKIRLAGVDARDAGNRKVNLAHSERVEVPKVPAVTRLSFAQPNPFRGTATLAFSLAQGGRVELAIYGVDGRRVRTLVSGVREAGEYREAWDGRDDQGHLASAGVYYAQLVAGKVHQTRTIVNLK